MDSRQRLIEATRDLLWERGYVGTSPGEIQKRASAGQGSMYHHFSGKEELALAAIRENVRQMKADIERVFDGESDALGKLSAYLQRQRSVLKGCRMGRLVQDPEIMSHRKLRQPIQDMFRWIQERIAGILESGCAAGEFKIKDAPALAATITATLQGGYVIARSENSAEPFNQAISGLLTLLKTACVRKK